MLIDCCEWPTRVNNIQQTEPRQKANASCKKCNITVQRRLLSTSELNSSAAKKQIDWFNDFVIIWVFMGATMHSWIQWIWRMKYWYFFRNVINSNSLLELIIMFWISISCELKIQFFEGISIIAEWLLYKCI